MLFDTYAVYQKSTSNQSWRVRSGWRERPLTASEIDRISDLELSLGHHGRAERLSHLAEQMREAGR